MALVEGMQIMRKMIQCYNEAPDTDALPRECNMKSPAIYYDYKKSR